MQPLLTPLWICTPLGAGVAKAVPGAVLVADAATGPCGRLPRWQASQTVLEGMCDPAPTGLVGGMPTMRPMPAKLALLPDAVWQATQLLLMPVCTISEPLNRAPLPTGSAVTEDPGPTWQTSHEAVVGMWLVGSPTTAKPMRGIANEAAAVPWHWAQLLVVLGALA